MGLADTVSGALGVGPQGFPAGYTGRVPDSEPRAILANELRQEPNNPDLRREVQLRFPDLLASAPAASVAPAQGFSAGPVLEALNAPPAAEPKAPGPLQKTLDTAPGAKAIEAGAQLVANQVTGIGSAIAGGYEGAWAGLKTLAKGGSLEDATNAGAAAVRDRQARGTYMPAEGTAGATAVNAASSNLNPLNWPTMFAHKGGDVTMDVTGSPAAATAVETGLNAVPLLFGVKKGAAVAEPRLVGSSSIADVKPTQVPISQIGQAENLEIPTILRRGGKVAVEAPGRAPLSLVPREGEAQPASAAQAPKPVLSLVPNEPTPGRVATIDQSPPEAAAAKAEAEAPKFAESAPVASEALPAGEQTRRSGVLQRVGIAPEEQRQSAVQGDGKAASTDFQTSKLDNASGDYMRTVLNNERAALTNHAENVVRDTGGTLGTDAQSLEARGHTILAPLDGLKDWFDTKTKALYQAADARAGGVPTEMPKTQALIGGDQAEFLGTTEGEALLRGVKARMKSLGMVDENGAPQAATVQQAEQLKQYLNNVWQPRTSRLIRAMKDSIDDDVTSSAGEDIYAQARQMRSMRAQTLDNPNGIAKLMDASGPEGINRSVPVERVADTVAAMPNAQFAHIIETLKNVPAELQPQAQAALAEIKAQFANRVRDAGVGPNGQPVPGGQWRARDVSTYLNKNSAKLAQVFEPEELSKLNDLNDAGHILAQDRSYPGASVQQHNLFKRGVMAVLPRFGAGLGAFVAGPAGAVVGDGLTAAAVGKFSDAAALKATQKRVGVKLSDVAK